MIKINVIVKNKSWFKFVKNPETYFKRKLKKIENDNESNETKIKDAKLFYDKHCDEKIIVNNFEKVFNEYKKMRELWE